MKACNHLINPNELCHYGRKGMKWYQNIFGKDGTILGKKKQETTELSKEEKKEKVLKSRSAAELYKNADLFTTQELRSAYDRLNLERNIHNLIPAEVSKGKKFVNSTSVLSNALGNTASMVNNGMNMYNNVAKVLNSVGGTNLKVIGESKNKTETTITDTIVETLADGTKRTIVKKRNG